MHKKKYSGGGTGQSSSLCGCEGWFSDSPAPFLLVVSTGLWERRKKSHSPICECLLILAKKKNPKDNTAWHNEKKKHPKKLIEIENWKGDYILGCRCGVISESLMCRVGFFWVYKRQRRSPDKLAGDFFSDIKSGIKIK